MITAIWPQYANLPNGIPASQGTESASFLSFFLFWYVGKQRYMADADPLIRLLQLPFVFIHPSKLKWMFNIKAVVVPICALGTLIWVSSNFFLSSTRVRS